MSQKTSKKTSKYELIADRLAMDIMGGVYPAGTSLPPVRTMMRTNQCSLATVMHAIDILVDRGMVRAEHGKGVFVEAPRPAAALPSVFAVTGREADCSRLRVGVVSALRQAHAGDMWWTRIIAGVDQVLRETGGRGQVRIFDAAGRAPAELVGQCAREGVNAILTLGDHWGPPDLLVLARECRARGIPAAIAWSSLPGPFPLHLVKTDNQLGVEEAVNHLADLGHRRIGYLGLDRTGFFWAEERHRAFVAAMAARGLAPAIDLDIPNNRPMQEDPALRRIARACTAVFCANDDLAVAMLHWARAHRVPVPGRLSIVGFDDDPFYRTEELTTVRTDLERIGRESVQLLAGLLGVPDDGMRITLRLATNLVVRTTTASPR